ncbi:MAG: acetyl-CoA carboxylase biotin carboxyl carrier protein [Brevinema sp.]
MKKILGIPMEALEEIKDLFEQTDIQDFLHKEKDRSIHIQRKKHVVITPVVMNTSVPTPHHIESIPVEMNEEVCAVRKPTESEDVFNDENKYTKIKSPIMGTFYTSSAPDMPNFAEIGKVIQSGDTVCIVEAMKIFNEIKASVSGTIVAILKQKGDNVCVDDELFVIEKK